jgi:hypothetical protein
MAAAITNTSFVASHGLGLGLHDGGGHVGHESEVELTAHVGRRLWATTKNRGPATCCAP